MRDTSFSEQEEIMVVCVLDTQIGILLSLDSFEVDISYKRLQGRKLNEVVFSTFLPEHGKSKYLL